MNWRDIDEVEVGWVRMPELGTMRCRVLKRIRTNDEPCGVTLVQWCEGAVLPVVWCHSQARYVFA